MDKKTGLLQQFRNIRCCPNKFCMPPKTKVSRHSLERSSLWPYPCNSEAAIDTLGSYLSNNSKNPVPSFKRKQRTNPDNGSLAADTPVAICKALQVNTVADHTYMH